VLHRRLAAAGLEVEQHEVTLPGGQADAHRQAQRLGLARLPRMVVRPAPESQQACDFAARSWGIWRLEQLTGEVLGLHQRLGRGG
jgi:hypothetical protein